jgi:hypothetical protein
MYLSQRVFPFQWLSGCGLLKEGKTRVCSGPRTPATVSAKTNSDCQGKVWQSSFEWLTQYGIKDIKGHWTCAMAGTGICPIYHCSKLPCHVPTQCPLLTKLILWNLLHLLAPHLNALCLLPCRLLLPVRVRQQLMLPPQLVPWDIPLLCLV